MKQGQLLNIRVLPKASDPSFEQREQGLAHTSYLQETIFYSYVQQGNVEMVRRALESQHETGIVVGHLSDNSIRQMQYWAICCVAIGIRYAIQGGLDEMTAFNLSDEYIMQIDSFTAPKQVVAYMETIILELTELVRKSAHGNRTVNIRKCLNYIDQHLHETIRLSDLAAVTNLSEDYVSKYFKKHMGKSIQDYVMSKRLEAAKAMLRAKCDQKQIAYSLGFCSQTYFITCFKKAFGTTPNQFAVSCHGVQA